VGYSVRLDSAVSARTRIKYVTDGVLLRECLADAALSAYAVVVLDEAHERSVATDVLFALVKEAVRRRPELRVVVTSATLEAEKFSAYFGGCGVLRVPGRQYPVETVWSASPASSGNIVEAVASAIVRCHVDEGEGHVLAFLTGQDDIEKTCASVVSKLKALEQGGAEAPPLDAWLLPCVPAVLCLLPRRNCVLCGCSCADDSVNRCYGAMSASQQTDIFRPVAANVRKIVVATNIAETSLTIDGIRFVVDSGVSPPRVPVPP